MFPSYLNRSLDDTIIASWDPEEQFFHIVQVHIEELELFDSRLLYSLICNKIGHSQPDQAIVLLITATGIMF